MVMSDQELDEGIAILSQVKVFRSKKPSERIFLDLLDGDNRSVTKLVLALWRAGIGDKKIVEFSAGQVLSQLLSSGYAEVVELMLNSSYCDSKKEKVKNTIPLYPAAARGDHRKVASLLSNSQISPHYYDDDVSLNFSPLFVAIKRRQHACVEVLLASPQVDPNRRFENYQTPLLNAVNDNLLDVVKSLLRCHRFDLPLVDGWTALHHAVSLCRTGMSRCLLSSDKLSLDFVGFFKATPLALAVRQKWIQGTKMLLADERVDPNANFVTTYGGSLLTYAIEMGNDEIAQLFLAYQHFDPRTCDSKGRTPLHAAALMNAVGAARILLTDERVNPNSLDGQSGSALSSAAEKGSIEVLSLLLNDSRVHPNIWEAISPLHVAVENGHCEAVQLLLVDQRIDPNMQNAHGDTPLCIAVTDGEQKMLNLLLADSRVDPNILDASGQGPLQIAIVKASIVQLRLLLADSRTDPNVRDGLGWTPLLHAVFTNSEYHVQVLLSSPQIDPNLSNRNGILHCRLLHATVFKLLPNSFSHCHMSIETGGIQAELHHCT